MKIKRPPPCPHVRTGLAGLTRVAGGLGCAAAATLLVGASFIAIPRTALAAVLPAGPLVQFIDAQEGEEHADISIEFACSVRYVTNLPVDHGSSTKITLRLGPDCAPRFSSIPPEIPLVGGGGHLVTGARIDSFVPGEFTLELTWARPLDFVMAPTASGIGLRVRLLNINRRQGKIFVAEAEAADGYSVNLDSSQEQYPQAAVEAAAAALRTQAYVSETDIEGHHWYRLRVGPFARQEEAKRVLAEALAAYPHAWLAINDEQTDLAVVERTGTAPNLVTQPTDAALPDAERLQLLHDARAALQAHRYPEAVDLLNQLLRQPEFPARADAQELLGLVRERAGQLAQAKAEYQEYLRRYPDGAAAARLRARLQTLNAASLAPRSSGEFTPAADNRWTVAGSAALTYQYGKDQTVAAGTATTTNTLSAALVYADLLLRDRGERFDLTTRVDAGYTRSLATTAGGGSQDRTTAAYAELTDRLFGVTARVGRQSLASQGIVGLFDGLYLSYQTSPAWSVSAAGGLPAYTSYAAPASNQKFATVAGEFDPFHHAWVFDAYLFDETIGSDTERRSIGLQSRYFAPGRTVVALIDYDLAFQQLNSASLIGNAKWGQSWILGFNADHRRSPLLELSNALIGQSVEDLSSLALHFTPSQIRQLALDRTSTSNTVVVSASRAFGERWQFMADLAGLELSGTPASTGVGAPPFGAVTATGSTGLDKNASLQLAGSSLLQAGDLHIFSTRFDVSPTLRSTTLSWDARFVVHGAWRLGPRLSVEQLNDPAQGGKQMLYLPQVRGDWTNRISVFELIAGYQLQTQSTVQQQILTGLPVTTTVDQRSLYVSAAYRIRF